MSVQGLENILIISNVIPQDVPSLKQNGPYLLQYKFLLVADFRQNTLVEEKPYLARPVLVTNCSFLCHPKKKTSFALFALNPD